jgi:type IV fimbrial biogenesis protein FimT
VRQDGFTLVELLVIVGLISIMSLFAYPTIRNMMAGYEFKGAARQIYGDLQMARLGAVKESRAWRVVFSPGTTVTSYTVRNGSDQVVKTVDVSGSSSGISYTENFTGNNVIFNSNGTASSGSITLLMGARTLQVRVNSNSGNIRIQ